MFSHGFERVRGESCIQLGQVLVVTGHRSTKCLTPTLFNNKINSDLSSRWIGGPFNIPNATREDLIEALSQTSSWIAVLWDTGSKIGHMVIVDGFDKRRLLLIRDPWASTRYKIRIEDLLNYWTDYGVYRRR